MKNILSHYPFLNEIPKHDLDALDLQVLVLLTGQEATIVRRLSGELDKNIVVYESSREANGGHLCRYLQFARLSESELLRLKAAEAQLSRGRVVVAYEKPLTFASS